MRQVIVNLVMMDRNRRLSPASVFDSDEIDVSGMSLMWVRNGILQLKYIRDALDKQTVLSSVALVLLSPKKERMMR